MSETKEQNSAYDKLTPERKQLVDMILSNLEKGAGLWKQGWRTSGAPISGITGKKYRGINNLFLSFIAMRNGYSDNRWVTFKQMEDRDWHFKTDAEGNSLGKGAGVCIEFYELRDRKTKKPFDRSVLDGMTSDEKADYERENVYPVRKYYRVFNADIIDGIPERERLPVDEAAQNARADKLLGYWSEHESKIIYGGDKAYYHKPTDKIHLPERADFEDMAEFYSTAFHEVGHSTGHATRLNRNLDNKFGDKAYAMEELRAEIALLFIEQDLEICVDASNIRNNSAYIAHWQAVIKDNPNALFEAITDAEKITRYISAKEQELTKKAIEPYAIVAQEDEYGETVYKVYMASSNGQIAPALSGYPFKSRDALLSEFGKLQEMPYWADKEFRETSMDELRAFSIERAERDLVREEKSEIYIKPSEVAARTVRQSSPVDMRGRGIESLTRMSDREIVEQAGKTKNGEKFSALYNGLSVLGNEEKDERSLMSRLAMFCGGDKEQLLRVFKSSGQFRAEKPNGFYEKMAEQSLQFIDSIKSGMVKSEPHTPIRGKSYMGQNAKV